MARRLKKKAKRRLLLISTLLVVLIGFVCFNFFGSDSAANLDNPLPNLTKPKEEPIKTYKALFIKPLIMKPRENMILVIC